MTTLEQRLAIKLSVAESQRDKWHGRAEYWQMEYSNLRMYLKFRSIMLFATGAVIGGVVVSAFS